MADDPRMTPDSPRARRVLDRIRATPPGFVRAYGDVSPGAPRFAGTVLSATDDPDVLGPSLSLPVADGRLAVGTWQGIYLCEHRDRGGARSLVATLQGETD